MSDLEREALADLLVGEGGEVVVPDEGVGQGGLAHALHTGGGSTEARFHFEIF